MQRGVRVYIDDIVNEVEQNLVGMEKLVLGMDMYVSVEVIARNVG